jgi:hypothetical protein
MNHILRALRPKSTYLLLAVLAAIPMGALLPACSQIQGGANENERTPGNNDTGVEIGKNAIAISPDGRYFVYGAGGSLQRVDLPSGTRTKLTGVGAVDRLAFDTKVPDVVYVTTQESSLYGYNTATKKVLWSRELTQWDAYAPPSILPTEDGERLVVALPDEVRVLESATGKLQLSKTFDSSVVDVDVTADSESVLVTTTETWEGDGPITLVTVIDLNVAAVTTIKVPNCADELRISKDGTKAFLAPTRCTQDPVSVIDLTKRKFVRNLPGFGPVDLANDGRTAVAFMDVDSLDRSLFLDSDTVPEQDGSRYHMMFIDVDTLAFDTLPLGDELPSYALTPDGNVLLVDDESWYAEERLRLVDVPARRLLTIIGPDVQLLEYVLTGDSTEAYLVDRGLFRLSFEDAHVTSVDLAFTPSNINITPDDNTLLLRNAHAEEIWLFDIEAQATGTRIETPGLTVDASGSVWF